MSLIPYNSLDPFCRTAISSAVSMLWVTDCPGNADDRFPVRWAMAQRARKALSSPGRPRSLFRRAGNDKAA
ncbi:MULTISPECIES: hypothetical protein [Methanothrix]|uniref:Uncharacterized protein n=2 Tax=root TaxID=1 RepID=A0A0W8F6W3_9ZZZZ|nr:MULTISPECIES: hypothetical protein [Methanothrix]MDY0412818.1 hypothetical protein [Methanothrix soehngenii]HOE46364.1 hypothetical protein [Methanothrix soehngenii]HOS23182.1 hypothetical protein [Methanothrix soehngenii]HPL21402.1 hypothetical protein [Methanothrix soehngenii]HRD15773.1 hypothetical protein [Methanothrix soehngenii]